MEVDYSQPLLENRGGKSEEIPKSQEPTQQYIELSISCRKLPNLDIASLTDPFVEVFE
jgi:hypothetical protein